MVTTTFDPPTLPALVVSSVSHARHRPLTHSFTYRYYQWLVDLDHLPRFRGPLALLATFRVRDHFDRGRLGGGIRGDIERFLGNRGITLEPDDRVIMLAHARAFGYVFDPMTAFWCLRPDGTPRAVVVEVHNTYRERHAYILHPDDLGRASVDKEFYVSPFNDVSGSYSMRFVLRPDAVAVAIRLDREGERVLDASVIGEPIPATRRTLLRTAARIGLVPQKTTLLIRIHAIYLWLRRLPTMPRPRHPKDAVR
jgi:DUF1365 family protein